MVEYTKKRNPAIALLLSLPCPGLGHVYNGLLMYGVVLFAWAWVLDVCLDLIGIADHFEGAVAWLGVEIGVIVFIAADAALDSMRRKEIEFRSYNRWYLYVICVVVSIAITCFGGDLIYRTTSFKIPLASMETALSAGDVIWMKLGSCENGKPPQRGEVVIFPYPEDLSKLFAKRVIGLEGEKLEIKNKDI